MFSINMIISLLTGLKESWDKYNIKLKSSHHYIYHCILIKLHSLYVQTIVPKVCGYYHDLFDQITIKKLKIKIFKYKKEMIGSVCIVIPRFSKMSSTLILNPFHWYSMVSSVQTYSFSHCNNNLFRQCGELGVSITRVYTLNMIA